jgi:hypothetical protein
VIHHENRQRRFEGFAPVFVAQAILPVLFDFAVAVALGSAGVPPASIFLLWESPL